MQATQAQAADPQADPHDDIATILRGGTPRTAHDPSELNVGAADRVSAAPELDMALRAVPLTDEMPPGPARPRRRVLRFMTAVGFGVAATIGWQSYGEAALQMVATWVPQLAAPAPEQAANAEPAHATPASEASAGETPAAATAAATPAAPDSAAPAQAEQAKTGAAVPPAAEFTPLIEGMSREIASLREAIEQLKTEQQKMGRDLARSVEKSLDKAAEKEPKRRVATPSPRPAAAPVRTAAPPPPPTTRNLAPSPPPRQFASERQTIVPPPTRLPPDDGYIYAPRPPLPLR